MTERPILSSAEMVRDILAGRKTQTRRVMKVQPWPEATVDVGPYHPHIVDRHGESHPGPATFGAVWDHQNVVNGGSAHLRCPYGAPGDMLWVRETWAPLKSGNVDFAADWSDTQRNFAGKWRPSIHMPRWASRITLRITDVRVERLQDITQKDAIAEGVEPCTSTGWNGDNLTVMTAREVFADLWNTIHGPGAWDANPWVWVIEFERVKPWPTAQP